MRRARSTSPPKSAWPGVSTMLMIVSFQWTDGVLRVDRDALLLLEVHRVHDALLDAAWLARKTPPSLQELVDEGGLAVVDVGDDGDVADVLVHWTDADLGWKKRPKVRVAARQRKD
jgi:hypothetical protein